MNIDDLNAGMKRTGLRPATIWITGLSASGKTTLGKLLFEGLMAKGIDSVEFLDGEALRSMLGRTYGYSTEERNAVISNTIRIAKEINKRGGICIVSTISHKRQTRQTARSEIGNFMEVYLNCPIEVCAKRDRKGHYAKALAGEYEHFVGVTEPYELSENPDLVLDTARSAADECADILIRRVIKFLQKEEKENIHLCQNTKNNPLKI